MDKVKFGIIGMGNMGLSHFKSFMEGKIESNNLKDKDIYVTIEKENENEWN